MQIEKNILAKNYIKLNLDNNQCINISKNGKIKNIPEKARDSFLFA